ncbi:hypothetical protein ACQCSX_06630 [Pseudarthrobacter sp. P1]|uniref:hypothetical protein n=1 Tax=Pseudarthrobacter sp. P1 TaxID=3418418 RepID=UPI003CF46E3D
MTPTPADPIEISTRMRPTEWTEESLGTLVGSYQDRLREMGAGDDEIATHIERPGDGSVSVRVSWHRGINETHSSTNDDVPAELAVARGDGEMLGGGEVTEDSQGLGAVLGDADRSAIDEPPRAGAVGEMEEGLVTFTDEDGSTHLEDTK